MYQAGGVVKGNPAIDGRTPGRYTQSVMALLALKNVSKHTVGTWALWDVTLEVGSGEIVGIFGRSGAGKSTLASILAGLEEATSGSIVIGDPDNPTPFKVAVALATPAYAPELSVYENLDMFASACGMAGRRRSKEIPAMLERLKLSEWRSARASSLSSGALIRLEIARGLLADSPVLVIDSLLDSLDPAVFESLWDYMLDLKRAMGKSFVILTGSGKVAEACGRIAVISRGRIGFLGRPEDFRRLAGEDVIVLGDMDNPLTRSRIQEQLSVVITEEDGFLSFRVAHGERVVGELLSEFGSEMSCVYLKRPTLEDALDVLARGGSNVTAGTGEKRVG
jgi:ABC-2 type transport system ATP-binding protein